MESEKCRGFITYHASSRYLFWLPNNDVLQHLLCAIHYNGGQKGLLGVRTLFIVALSFFPNQGFQ